MLIGWQYVCQRSPTHCGPGAWGGRAPAAAAAGSWQLQIGNSWLRRNEGGIRKAAVIYMDIYAIAMDSSKKQQEKSWFAAAAPKDKVILQQRPGDGPSEVKHERQPLFLAGI